MDDEIIIYKLALEIAARSFWKSGVKDRGLSKYIIENSQEAWLKNHIDMWLKKASRLRKVSENVPSNISNINPNRRSE
jgi:hypothetical protein